MPKLRCMFTEGFKNQKVPKIGPALHSGRVGGFSQNREKDELVTEWINDDSVCTPGLLISLPCYSFVMIKEKWENPAQLECMIK